MPAVVFWKGACDLQSDRTIVLHMRHGYIHTQVKAYAKLFINEQIIERILEDGRYLGPCEVIAGGCVMFDTLVGPHTR